MGHDHGTADLDDHFGRPRALQALWRGATMRCPRCGSGGLFRHWMTMCDDCPRCGLHFERTEGYWLGAMVINLGITLGLFLAVFVGGLVLFWPDVPWNALLVAVVVVSALTPVLVHPLARTSWVAIERQLRSRTEPYA